MRGSTESADNQERQTIPNEPSIIHTTDNKDAKETQNSRKSVEMIRYLLSLE